MFTIFYLVLVSYAPLAVRFSSHPPSLRTYYVLCTPSRRLRPSGVGLTRAHQGFADGSPGPQSHHVAPNTTSTQSGVYAPELPWYASSRRIAATSLFFSFSVFVYALWRFSYLSYLSLIPIF
ncbi:hypothetical protein FA95DRAFT_713792 [Auriscalpium vulgare]|uniref:Uncharacterized protein n=1 Tax=Auriscalpium vulgare TaxID=40419 RepID=A0ACB8RAX9_9AGAM|nr:hypothetical protein FA95DRAFT_713792 [Auriscalpium vulgare]